MLPLSSVVVLILDEENQILMGERRGEHVTLLGKQSCLSVSMILGLFFPFDISLQWSAVWWLCLQCFKKFQYNLAIDKMGQIAYSV